MDLELVFDNSRGNQTVGIRFNEVNIPQDALIVNAYIQFQVDETNSVLTSLNIRGEDVDDAAVFVNQTNNLSLRDTTNAEVTWSPPTWDTVGEVGIDQQTPNIALVIQEIVTRPDWSSGNSLTILITGTGERTAESFDGNPLAAPILHIEYIPDGPLPNLQPSASNDFETTLKDTPIIIDVLLNDNDVNGDNSSSEADVANMVDSFNPEFIITVGDNTYNSNPLDINIGQYYSDYMGNYNGAYGSGSEINRFFPSLGNHDWDDGGGINAYLDYFDLPGDGIASTNTSGNERYYDFVQGPIHFFVLDSDSNEPDGRAYDSIQGQWLEAALTGSTATWNIVYMHQPAYSSKESTTSMRWPYEDWGADAVLSGHRHSYERILRDDNNDGIDIAYIANGIGGASLGGTPISFIDESQFFFNDEYGAMLITANNESITFELYSITNGGTLIDTYTINNLSAASSSTSTSSNALINQSALNEMNAEELIVFDEATVDEMMASTVETTESQTTTTSVDTNSVIQIATNDSVAPTGSSQDIDMSIDDVLIL